MQARDTRPRFTTTGQRPRDAAPQAKNDRIHGAQPRSAWPAAEWRRSNRGRRRAPSPRVL